jgi:hypothetical protein
MWEKCDEFDCENLDLRIEQKKLIKSSACWNCTRISLHLAFEISLQKKRLRESERQITQSTSNERDRDGSGVGERVRKQNSAVEAIQNISASEVSVVDVW